MIVFLEMYFLNNPFLPELSFPVLLLNLLIADMPHAHKHHKSREIHILEKIQNAAAPPKKVYI